MFRTHVREGAAEHSGFSSIRIDVGRHVEISQQRPAIRSNKDVGGLDVAVQDPLAMGVVQGLGQPGADPTGCFEEIRLSQQLAVA